MQQTLGNSVFAGVQIRAARQCQPRSARCQQTMIRAQAQATATKLDTRTSEKVNIKRMHARPHDVCTSSSFLMLLRASTPRSSFLPLPHPPLLVRMGHTWLTRPALPGIRANFKAAHVERAVLTTQNVTFDPAHDD